jgi:hypothetical protein
MPDELARLAVRAKSAFARTRASRTEWIAATLELAATLCQARERLPNNDAFGIWLGQAGLETLSKDDRAALINIGAHVDEAQEVFAEYDGLSWRMAWQQIRHLRSLRTRDEAEQTVENAQATNVIALPLVVLPSHFASESDVCAAGTAMQLARQFDTSRCKEAMPLLTAEAREREGYLANVICSLIYSSQFWKTTDQLSRLVDYWARGRGDHVPTASEIRDLARWFDDFAKAIETYQPKPRRSGGST